MFIAHLSFVNVLTHNVADFEVIWTYLYHF